MSILKRLVFVQSILLSSEFISSKVYLKPVDRFSSQNADLDEKKLFFVTLPNYILEPVQKNTVSQILKKAMKKYEFSTNVGKTHGNIDSEDVFNDLSLNDVQKDILRKRWRSSCDKKASKTCTKACRSAYKIVCSTYKCKRKMKKSFKKECKRNCKSRFISTVSDESE